MVAAGIIDPAKVTRSALENAASVSAMVLTTCLLYTSFLNVILTPAFPSGKALFRPSPPPETGAKRPQALALSAGAL